MSLTATTTATSIDPLSFREALGHYASGITVITSHTGDEPIGFTCQSFYSVSMNPPLVSFSVMCSSASYPKIREQVDSQSIFCPVNRLGFPTSSLAEARISGMESNGRNLR